MATVTKFNGVDTHGLQVSCDAHGNNVAFGCLGCGGPVLATIREHQRGSSAAKPSQCPTCSSMFWVDVDVLRRVVIVNRLP